MVSKHCRIDWAFKTKRGTDETGTTESRKQDTSSGKERAKMEISFLKNSTKSRGDGTKHDMVRTNLSGD